MSDFLVLIGAVGGVAFILWLLVSAATSKLSKSMDSIEKAGKAAGRKRVINYGKTNQSLHYGRLLNDYQISEAVDSAIKTLEMESEPLGLLNSIENETQVVALEAYARGLLDAFVVGAMHRANLLNLDKYEHLNMSPRNQHAYEVGVMKAKKAFSTRVRVSDFFESIYSLVGLAFHFRTLLARLDAAVLQNDKFFQMGVDDGMHQVKVAYQDVLNPTRELFRNWYINRESEGEKEKALEWKLKNKSDLDITEDSALGNNQQGQVLFGNSPNRDFVINEEALVAAVNTTITLVHNTVAAFGIVPTELTEAELISIEEYFIGAYSVLLTTACDLEEGVDLGHEVGTRVLSKLAREILSSGVRLSIIYHFIGDADLKSTDVNEWYDQKVHDVVERLRFVSANPQLDQQSYDLGVQQAHILVLHFNKKGPEPNYAALHELFRSRGSIY
ncbi:hypothetical protein [Pseudohalocynthiibacter sp. F2068]|uniref:hypothetical protein n=1 Tax=Pseudohalocynthiibacter sp. F2068 TaxID=2926418 RepID=UPI001FF0E525|nr:hypothetical protein [Pseudohalocynthiibacter sp. F2068]MCK0104387.1 hypothetical protein [Pseudohalocynthiibacter sp. F2068]